MLQIKTDLYRYVHYTSNVAVCNYQELIGCDVSFMVVLISERHGGLFSILFGILFFNFRKTVYIRYPAGSGTQKGFAFSGRYNPVSYHLKLYLLQ